MTSNSSLLNDKQLVGLINHTQPIVVGLPRPPSLPALPGGIAPDPWYGPESAIQPSSMDLHIGDILLPGVRENKLGSVKKPKIEHTLKVGQTAVVTTLEQVKLPNNIAAMGFPPTRLSFRGLLMTNPGHIDPGYFGCMKFTVMNIGGDEITLRKGDPIVTLLFFELSGDAQAGYAQRFGLGPIQGPTQDKINGLSHDFLNVTSRAEAAATKAVSKAELKVKYLVPFLTAVAAIGVALATGFFTVWQPVNLIKTDVEGLKKVLDMGAKSRLDKLEDVEKLLKRIDELEKGLQSSQNAGGKR